MKTGDTIWIVKINKPSPTNTSCINTEGIEIRETKILGLSDYKVCLDTDWFQTLDRVREGRRKDLKYNSYLDTTSVSIRVNESILGDGVYALLYSTKKPTKRTLNSMYGKISNEIDKRFGWMMSDVKDSIYVMIDSYNFKTK